MRPSGDFGKIERNNCNLLFFQLKIGTKLNFFSVYIHTNYNFTTHTDRPSKAHFEYGKLRKFAWRKIAVIRQRRMQTCVSADIPNVLPSFSLFVFSSLLHF